MTLKEVKKEGNSPEARIKEAARKLFTTKGFHATRTRDIANEAGINLALLNYYFGSKKKLFEIVNTENMKQFVEGITTLLNDEQTDLQQKITLLVNRYIDNLLRNPELPLFVLSQVNKERRMTAIRERIMQSYFIKQLSVAEMAGEIMPINPFNLLLNIVGLTIFPFIARQTFLNNDTDTQQFEKMIEERRVMVPRWIMAMLTVERPSVMSKEALK